MIVEKTLEVSAQEYYDFLIDALHKELKRIGIKSVKKSDIKAGYSFTKKYKKQKKSVKIPCTILQLERPLIYEIKMEGAKGNQYIKHTMEAIDEHHMHLIYEERIETTSFMIRLSQTWKQSRNRKTMMRSVEILEEAVWKANQEKQEV